MEANFLEISSHPEPRVPREFTASRAGGSAAARRCAVKQPGRDVARVQQQRPARTARNPAISP